MLPGMDAASYLPIGDAPWRSTVHTTGPWDALFQHGRPPSALLDRAIEQCSTRDDMLIARMTVDILGAIPVGELELRSRMLRPGRSVELVEAALSAGGREVARAQAWRVLRTDQEIAPRGPGSGIRSFPASRRAHCSAWLQSPTAATASAASWT